MSKRVLVLANNSDGLYGFRRELLAALCRAWKVLVSVPDDGFFDELRAIGCTVEETAVDRRGINPITDFGLFGRYLKLLRKLRPNLVITYTIKPNVYGGLACRLMGIPYAANITGLGTAFQKHGALRKLVVLLYKLALKRAKVVFFENIANMRTFEAEGIVRQDQCKLLNGAGVNLERFCLTPYPEEDSPIHFLFIGRVMAEKGINELFSAMERLYNEGVACSLDVLGNYEEDYARQIEEKKAQGWLHYHGYQADVRPFIERAHCFVLPSWHEGMANTNLEAAASGRPLITSRIHGCMEAVIEGKSGLLCEPKNADSLYDAMHRFCEMPHEQREAMGKAGRQHMETVFDKKKVVSETLERIGHGIC